MRIQFFRCFFVAITITTFPLHSVYSESNSTKFTLHEFGYNLNVIWGRGAFGEVWQGYQSDCFQNLYNFSSLANSSNESTENRVVILKRILAEKGHTDYLSGLREKYFGEIFLNASILHERACHDEGLNHIARYLDSFKPKAEEIWLVFKHEGVALSRMIYTSAENELGNLRKHSSWWHWLRTTKEGENETKNLIRQLLLALKSCHDRNITHRDIKPENMVLCFQKIGSTECLKGIPTRGYPYNLKLRVIDFGSAMDGFALKHLYGSGPTNGGQTLDYTPPEALLNAGWFHKPTSVVMKYDMWSVGVMMLELITGTPNNFQIGYRTRGLMNKQLEGWSDDDKELMYKLRAYVEMCILVPWVFPRHHKQIEPTYYGENALATWKCSEEFFAEQVKSMDPLKIGFPNVYCMRLVRRLLRWHPEDRLSVDEALNHEYFKVSAQEEEHQSARHSL